MTISSQPLSGPSLEILRDNRGGDDGRGQGRRVGDEEIVDEERKERKGEDEKEEEEKEN